MKKGKKEKRGPDDGAAATRGASEGHAGSGGIGGLAYGNDRMCRNESGIMHRFHFVRQARTCSVHLCQRTNAEHVLRSTDAISLSMTK